MNYNEKYGSLSNAASKERDGLAVLGFFFVVRSRRVFGGGGGGELFFCFFVVVFFPSFFSFFKIFSFLLFSGALSCFLCCTLRFPGFFVSYGRKLSHHRS